jgi:DNA-binding CsgD family transcriptional regulator
VLGILVVLALAGAGAAFAANRTNDHECAEARGGPRLAVRQAFTTAADYVGLSRAELLGRLRDGQSLAEIAEAEGKSVEGLKQAIRAAITARLDARVDDLVQRARAPRS